ncbi:bifunctional hydroxymethylpyrimidine kinase/phosphomethylpyrimidine kinase [Alicycliphilus denitrificans]|uniref:bifunctional hydroxymethylpyrimidine kinase/phosphomethylpyrimidine kinase n=1 Tax=Alicycliphilus denitrificans TaxID=179636 RepID=UPI000961DE94|nr:bifunctional hydroxymethylpyrimidine kinase/phosphomethylpyrimidine kinase [Alicycliphilus denitrificans]MBN9574511.1 bifunctional hydroxymethylpyrimidine kinase/phosphomethylpyrimidine kinase [Alicycliphilus denitrificans]OJW82767.1 MAG: hydroxymethylpyrimidine/phosphomethylpyrimidine kinase [Alicycliphilus sp. 69-12]
MAADDDDTVAPAICVMVFNANDPSGAGGLAGDVAAVASVGGHPVPVVTGAYARDSAEVFDHYPFDDDMVSEQARAVLEDMAVQAIKVGFVGSPENLSAIAGISADYADIPVIAYMPDLSWWRDDLIDQYHDAFRELLLPQASVLVGNHSTLWRWLLPDWSSERAPSPRDLAMAASESGVPYLLVTGIPAADQHIDNVLASAQSVLGSGRFERFEASFIGAGDTLSATLAALVASGCDLGEAMKEALTYLDGALEHGFRPGMGHVLPDRMFWAQPDDEDDNDDEPSGGPQGFDMPPHDTQH